MAWKFTYCNYPKHVCLLLIAVISFSFSFSQNIFQPADVPAFPLLNDGQPIQTGVKFSSSQNGFIKGIRYYKGAGSTGSRIGQLWSSTGTLMASTPFTNETASGWQEVLFNTPVAIIANTTYVAACYSSSGDYAITNPYFSQAVVNGPLRALANGEDGPNGVFIFSQIPMFPTNNFQTSNYWVDVVFLEDTSPDVTAPVISSVSPAGATTGVGLNATVTAIFNEAVDPSTINSSTFELRNTFSNTLIAATVTYNASARTAILTPSSAFANAVSYTAKIKGGQAGAKDLAGNPLANDYTWAFTSADLPFLPPTEGYGGPILVLSNANNPFNVYAAEMLRAEGLTEFAVKDISAVNGTTLSGYDVIVLGEMPVTAAQVTMLSKWADAGGTLIAFKPAASLTSLLGISAATGTLSDKYLRVNTLAGPGAGIVGETIQFHGEANLHTLNGATGIATLYTDAITATANPAVTTINVGTSGGKAIAFTYDLARSIIYTRQGNPAWAGQERDGQAGPIRSNDMFFGLPANTGADWVDFNKIAIPQADEQQRLLANIIIQSNLHRKPLPRLWYLPKRLKAAIVMTGDDHANNGTTGRFNHYMTLGPNSPEDVANWNAIRGTSYLYPNTPLSNAQAVAFQAQGFEIALHPSTGCTDYTEASLTDVINTQMGNFTSSFPGVFNPVTNRTHCLVWSDWASHARVEAQRGMRLDVNYYYWPDTWVQNRPGMFTGAGMPMRFADMNGSLIDCYQVTTQMTDESGIDYTNFCNQLLDKATGPEGYYGTFCANMHTDSTSSAGSAAIIASAMNHKIPVISAKQLLTWLDGRNNSSFDSITWNDNQLRFRINAPSGARNLYGMLPRYIGNTQLTAVTRDGLSAWSNTETIKGMEYVFFGVAVGSYSYVATYSAVPAVTIHPVSQAICEGATVSFTSAATGSPAPSVQWQQSNNGAAWENINNAANSTFTFTPAITDNNKQYRAVWTNIAGSVNADPAALTVKAVPVLSSPLIAPEIAGGTLFSYTPTSLTAGTTFSWSRAEVMGITNPAATGTGSINETLINVTNSTIIVTYVYKLSVNGCVNTQNVVVKVAQPVQQGCSFNTSIVANFNSSSIPAGRYIWFNSIFKPGSLGTAPVNFYVTNAKITYTLNNQLVSLRVPDAHIKFASTINTATTKFIDGKWKTEIPISYNGNVFMSGLSYLVPGNIPGGVRNVTWSATIETDKENASLQWKWTAGVYTNFTGNAGLNIKPVDGLLFILNPLLSLGNAGTPLNYSLFVVPGAMGAGLLNITSTYSATKTETCANSANAVTSARQVQSQPAGKTMEEQPVDQQLDIRVMPNPGIDYFNITIKGSGKDPVSIRILDIFGQVVEKYEKINTSAVLRVGHGWTGGTYFAEVIQGGQRKVVKLIKTN
ncbi:MAG: DUF4082 domain-containing protein [Bacteroidota bacterium]